MRRWLVLRVKNTQNRTAQRPREQGPLALGRELPTLLASQKPLSFLWASFFLFSFALGDLFWDPQGDCLERRGAFLSCDFGLPRTGSSSAVHFWQSGFPSFILGHFFLLSVGLGLEMEWAETFRTFWPHR